MANVQHDNTERGTLLSLLGNCVPSKRACCFDVPDLIIDSTMPTLTKRFYWWPCRFLTGAQKMRSKLIEVSGFIPCLCNSASFSVHNASLQKMYSVHYCTSVCVGGCVFPAFVIQSLWVCWVASREEMYSVGCFSSICVGGCVFPVFIIQNLWVCTLASLQECAARNELHRLLHQCMCEWLCVSCLRNSINQFPT